jgi:arabinose-5-phosphate isomerase
MSNPTGSPSSGNPRDAAISAGRRTLEIEASALTRMAVGLGPSFADAVDRIAALRGRLVCTGMGKSGHVARKIAATLASTGQPAMFVHPGEASHGDLGMIGSEDAVLALSKTGETRELADIIAHTRRFGIPLIGMTADPDSALGRACDLLLQLPDAPEAVDAFNAPTTSTTAQIALGDALAVALVERRGFGAQDFRVFHPGGKLGAALRTVRELMHGAEELPLAGLDTPMPEALLVMTEKRFGCVGVVDEAGALVGLITDGDLRRHMDGLMQQTARRVMTAAPTTVPPAMLAGEALNLMNTRRITVLFVVDAQRPVGVLHVHDLLRQGVA